MVTKLWENEIFTKTITEKNSNGLALELNSIIEATIVKNDNQMLQLISDKFKFELPAGQVIGEVGDDVKFKIINNTKDSLLLKQVIDKKQEFSKAVNREIKSLKELFKESNFIPESESLKELIEQQNESSNVMSNIRNKIMYSSNNLNKNAISELVSQGISLEKIDLSMLTTTIQELKASDKDFIDTGNLTDEGIDKALRDNGLPNTSSNINALENLQNKVKYISDVSDIAISNIIKQDTDLTVKNIYTGIFTAGEKNISNTNFNPEEFKEEIGNYLSENDIELTEKNVSYSKFLFSEDLPITKENIIKVDLLKNINNYINEELILNNGALNIKNNSSVLDVNIFNLIKGNSVVSEDLYTETISNLPTITEENVNYLINKNIPITLSNFNKNINNYLNIQEETQQIINTKKTLLEIQMKLTYEASQRLYKNNIDINVMPIEAALDTLKEQERLYYETNIKIVEDIPNESKVESMVDVFNKIGRFNLLTNNVYGDILLNKVDFSIDGIDNSYNYAKARDGYEVFQTVVSPKYGDAFYKVKPLFKEFLENMDIEITDKNIKAAIILSKNDIDITEENLLKIKLIDVKIENVYDRLHPIIVANMIKSGLNPAKMHIDEVIKYIDNHDDILGNNLRDKIASYILELDDSKTLNKGDREAIIAVYKMLNSIVKNDSVALGVMLKNGFNMTLGNMLDSYKNYKRNDLNYNIDDDFGMLDTIVGNEDTIKSILSENEKTQSKLEYDTLLFKNLIRKSDPKTLWEIVQNTDNFNMHIEDLLEEINIFNEKLTEDNLNKNINNYIDKVQTMLKTSPSFIATLESLNIKPSVNNVISLLNLKRNLFYVDNVLNEINISNNDKLNIQSTDLEYMKENKLPIDILENLAQQIEDYMDDNLEDVDINTLTSVQNTLDIQKMITKNSNNVEFLLPIKMKNKISSLYVYMVNNEVNTDDFKMYMSLNTNNFGVVDVIIDVVLEKTNIKVLSENKEYSHKLENNQEFLKNILKDSNYNVDNLVFSYKQDSIENDSILLMNNFENSNINIIS